MVKKVKKTKFAAIDVGTSKVCTIMADTSGVNGLRVLGVGTAPSQGMHKGLVVNANEVSESIRESIRRAEKVAGVKLESAFVGVTGQHVNSINNQGAIAITRNRQIIIPEDLRRVIEVASSVNIPDEYKLLHIIPRSYKVDGQEGISNPVGMHGFRLDAEVHVITIAITSFQNLTKCIHGLGVEIAGLVLEPLASAEAVLTEDERQEGVMLADIGGGMTDIAVFKGGNVYCTSILPVSGYQMTRDISIALGFSFEQAEEIKKQCGDITPGYDNKQRDKTLVQNGYTISCGELSDIIKARTEELLRLIMLELPDKERSKLIPSGLVITGGCANLPGIVEVAAAVTHLPVRIGTPSRLDGVSDVLLNPTYATGVGLILWQANKKDKPGWRIKGNAVTRFLNSAFKLLPK